MLTIFFKKFVFFYVLFFLISCVGETITPTKGPEGDPSEELNFAQFDDMPIPIGSSLDQKNSIIISKEKIWLGRLTFECNKKQLEIFDFFRNELPKFGWVKLSEVRADSSLLNYIKDERIASVQIESKAFFGSIVKVTVTEKN